MSEQERGTSWPELPSKTPVHIALRLVEGVPSLRRLAPVRYIRRCIQLAHKDRFRVVEFSVQSNHVHLIVEAEGRRALARGMQGLKIRLTRRLNALFGRRGTIFTDRGATTSSSSHATNSRRR